MNKEELRKKVIEERKKINTSTISIKIIENIRKMPQYKTSEHVMIFYPMKYEIDLLNLLNDKKIFYLPKIDGEDLKICLYKPEDKLMISEFGTKEPQTESVDIEQIDLIFVPALCVDENNYRLGYGRGFFDRLLKRFDGVSITPIPEQFIFKTIPHDENDVAVDIVITENY